jgi:hypothetical protein
MNRRSFIAALSAVFILTSLAGCDKATKPKNVKYNLYVGATHIGSAPDSSYNRIYIYDADSLTLLDSISQAHFTAQLAVSPDGRWLYILDFTGHWQVMTMWKIDARTKQVAWSRSDRGGYLRFLANGKLLLAGNDVLRPDDGGLVRHIDDSLRLLWGPAPGTVVAATVSASPPGPENDSVIRAIDVVTGEVSGRYVARLSTGVALQDIHTARLHPDGRRVLAIGVYGSVDYSWFVVGDIETGQTLFQQRIYRHLGEIAISSDGSLAAVTDPGTPGFFEGGTLHVVDLRTLSFITPTPRIPGSQVRFLPGDQKIITAPAADPGLWDSGPMRIIDRTTLQLEKTIWPIGFDSAGNWSHPGGLGVGPRP